jgi:hypothetical protein
MKLHDCGGDDLRHRHSSKRDMNRILQITFACVIALVLVSGCRRHRTREFVAVQKPVQFENWRLYVSVFVDAANPPLTNHFYLVSAMAWTAPGKSIGPDPNQFRPTAYDTSLDSLRLFRVAGTNSVELPLPPLNHGPTDHSNRLVQLGSSNRAGIQIPASVSELRADVAMTFNHRETGKTDTKVFAIPMIKRERTKLEPMLE